GRRSKSSPNEVKLVAVIVCIHIVTDKGAEGNTEGTTLLLGNSDAWDRGCGTITESELVWVGVGLDGSTELLSRHEVQVLHVVRVDRGWLCAGGGLVDSGQTVPGYTGAVCVLRGRVGVEDAVINASLVLAIAG